MMKTENVLTVLMYLFKHHVKKNTPNEATEAELVVELKSAGFKSTTIDSALSWLSKLAPESIPCSAQSPQSRRILTPEEKAFFDLECQNYLLFLQNQNIISPVDAELVINQLIDLKPNAIDVGLIQWVTLMFLYNQDNQGRLYQRWSFLVLQEQSEVLH